jgi:hypothetical protein
MSYREIIPVCFEIHKKQMHLFGKKAEIKSIKSGGA